MSEKRLFLHIGSYKTGSTAIQGFLKSNAEALAGAGVNYVKAGRTNISHNSMLRLFRQKRGARVCGQIAREIETDPAPVHVVSSEMFFRSGSAKHLAANLPPELKARTTIVVYIRRQDKYLEAMYKQLVKNNRIAPDAGAFYESQWDKLEFSAILDAYADRFGIENMIVRPFERRNFPQGDVVMDFLGHLGVTLPPGLAHIDKGTNKTLSAPVSEMLGMLGRDAGVNTRVLIRKLIEQDSQGAVRSNDVYDLAARRALVERYAQDNDRIRKTYCPDLEDLFQTDDLERGDDPYPDPQQQVENWSLAAQAIAKGLGGLRA